MTMMETGQRDPLACLRSWEPKTSAPRYVTPGGMREADDVGKVVFRSDTGDALALVGPRYTPVSNADKVALFDALAESGRLTNLRAGEFGGGRRVFLQGQPQGGQVTVAGLPVQAMLTVCDSYDSTTTCVLVDSDVCIVCSNTWARAHRTGKGLRLRHTGSIRERFADAVQAIQASVADFGKSMTKMEALAAAPLPHQDWKDLLDTFWPLPALPAPGIGKREAETAIAKRENVQGDRNRLSWALEAAPGARPGTRLGAYQAVTYFLTHERGRAANRLESNMLGESARVNRAVLAHLLN